MVTRSNTTYLRGIPRSATQTAPGLVVLGLPRNQGDLCNSGACINSHTTNPVHDDCSALILFIVSSKPLQEKTMALAAIYHLGIPMKRLRLAILVLIAGNQGMVAFGGTRFTIQPVGAAENSNTAIRLAGNANGVGDGPIRLGETFSECGPPGYQCSYDGTDAKPLCTNCNLPPVPDMSAQPNAVYYDKLFGIKNNGNQIVRCTYPDTNQGNNHTYVIGSGGSGDSHVIGKAGGTPPTYRLIIGDTHGAGYPFTYEPDPVHPKCHPTYDPIWSYPVGDGAFSWVTPHLYYTFGNFRVKTIDLGSLEPPNPIPVANFQQILPRDGTDWPGADKPIVLGAIIRPHVNNDGKYLYQATCPAKEPTCSPGATGITVPNFNQNVMTNTPDGTVRWRNIGVGFNSPYTWSPIGGVFTDEQVFVEGFLWAGWEGGPGGIFLVA